MTDLKNLDIAKENKKTLAIQLNKKTLGVGTPPRGRQNKKLPGNERIRMRQNYPEKLSVKE